MALTHQPLLCVPAEVGFATDLAAATRTYLNDGAWIDHLPGWIGGADEVFEVLLRDVPWRADRRQMYDRVVDTPRLLAWYRVDDLPAHAIVTDARDLLSAHYRHELGEDFASAGLCLYRDGSDSVAWHGDRGGRASKHDTMVAIVSFGAPRMLLLRPRSGGSNMRFSLGHGDLLVMGGSCQRTWEHAVPKTSKAVGPRVSVQYRPAGVF